MQRYRNARGTVRPPRRRLPPERLLRLVLSHAIIVLSGMYIVFYVLDHIGRSQSMNFINNEITKALLLALVLLSIFNAALALVRMHKGIGEKDAPQSARAVPRPQERSAYRQPSIYAREGVSPARAGAANSAAPRHMGGQSAQRPSANRSGSSGGRHSGGY